MNTFATFTTAALVAGVLATTPVLAESYTIDDPSNGAHASINFKIKHLGYSWLTGRFDRFSGQFEIDPAKPQNARISVTIDPASVNSNNPTRDTHLRSADFLDVKKFPAARFESTSITLTGDNTADVKGKLTLRGVTREIPIKAKHVGGGKDPWGGFRRGFTGTTEFKLADFGIPFNLGPSATTVFLDLNIEGIRQ